MIYIFCTRKSEGAFELSQALKAAGVKAKRWRRAQTPALQQGDLVVSWGESPSWKRPKGCGILNDSMKLNKLQELVQLHSEGVRVPPFKQPGESPGQGWLKRRMNHQGGHDLLHPPHVADYWVKKLPITDEWRVHVFNGEVIRIGKKVPAGNAPNHHAWIRSHDAGWTLHYKGQDWRSADALKLKKVRALAKKAVEALGLDFAAVDTAWDSEGALVLEVNRAPGMEPSTLAKYVERVRGYAGSVTTGAEAAVEH